MAKQLIIVESPAKVKTIKKFLGSNYMVQASVGHVRDLPTSALGVDEENNFAPQYEIIEKKKDLVKELRQAASKADTVYLAPDPDREGEAIAWHVAELIKGAAHDIKRIQFNEITERAVKEAIAHPRELNTDLFEAQQARRILDRLVGYKISPLLWKTIKRGISAGRVQSVALKLIVEREREREEFKPEEYWPFHAILSGKSSSSSFKAELIKINGKKALIKNAEEAAAFEASLAGHPFVVDSVEAKQRIRPAQPPFITSTLQQTSNQRLGYTAKRTMQIAQRLYEGVDIGEKGVTALITYMRTDSTRVAEEARDAARAYIINTLGERYLPKKPNIYKAKSSSQDAHEAIRPVDVTITPESLEGKLPQDQLNVYKLIWSRFMASQMAPAVFNDTVVLVSCGKSVWRAKGAQNIFDGFLKVQPYAQESEVSLPALEKGEELKLDKLEKERKFTQPPARYSEATLVKELEEKGIGRPSTYASIISTLLDRDYARLEDKRLCPTDLGRLVCSQLVKHFTQLMDTGFTAHMEEGLDRVAEGGENWVQLLTEFAADFNPALESASKNMQSMKSGVPAGIDCPECGKPLLIKFGKAGAFLACSGYPECRFTSNFERNSDGRVEAVKRQKEPEEKVGECPLCGSDLVARKSHAGARFIACSAYPECKYAASFPTGVNCPECGKGSLVEKITKKGKIFYSCDQYPACKCAMWHKPVPIPCPACGSPYLVEKKTSQGVKLACPEKNCGYEQEENDGQAGD